MKQAWNVKFHQPCAVESKTHNSSSEAWRDCQHTREVSSKSGTAIRTRNAEKHKQSNRFIKP